MTPNSGSWQVEYVHHQERQARAHRDACSMYGLEQPDDPYPASPIAFSTVGAHINLSPKTGLLAFNVVTGVSYVGISRKYIGLTATRGISPGGYRSQFGQNSRDTPPREKFGSEGVSIRPTEHTNFDPAPQPRAKAISPSSQYTSVSITSPDYSTRFLQLDEHRSLTVVREHPAIGRELVVSWAYIYIS